MLKNLLRVAFRNIWKSKFTTIINLAGLSIAVGCAIVSFLLARQMMMIDTFHENRDRIYMVGNEIVISENREVWADNPTPLGPAMLADIPQVEKAVRVEQTVLSIRQDSEFIRENVLAVDEDFFDVFTFPLLQGSKDALSEPNSTFITQRYAKIYFGEEDPIGKELVYSDGPTETNSLVVRGVTEDPKPNASFNFDIIIPFSMLLTDGDVIEDSWSNWTKATFILLKEGVTIDEIEPLCDKYVVHQNEVSPSWAIDKLIFIPLLKASRNADDYENNICNGVPHLALIMMSAGALFLLLLACSNYTNHTIVNITRRFHEIGLRKVVGGNSTQILMQHIGENFLFLTIAFIISIILAEALLIPGWNIVAGSESGLEMNVLANPQLWIFFAAMLLIVGTLTGLYPAWIAAKFQVSEIFRKSSKTGGGSKFIRGLITFQFFVTLLFLIFTIGVYQNAHYQMNKDWGYDQENVLVLPLPDASWYDVLSTKINEIPEVESVAGVQTHFGRMEALTGINVNDIDYRVQSLRGSAEYIDVMKMRLKEGRTFEGEFDVNIPEIVINETFVEAMGWENPLEQQLKIGTTNYSVIGIVEDFHALSFARKIPPLMIRMSQPENYRLATFRISEGASLKTSQRVKEIWAEVLPNMPYRGYFQDESFSSLEEDNDKLLKLFTFSGGAALLISLMGIIGIVAATLVKRQREIAIRKVMGARVRQIIDLIIRPFVLIFLIASTLASVAGWFLFKMFLNETFAYHVQTSPQLIAIAFGSLLAVILITLVLQTIRAAFSNPSDVLRDN
jgi:putative ABC transport system permease protein